MNFLICHLSSQALDVRLFRAYALSTSLSAFSQNKLVGRCRAQSGSSLAPAPCPGVGDPFCSKQHPV